MGRILNKGWTWAAGLGLLPETSVVMRVRSSASHRFYSVVLVAAKYRGHRYLVSMLGNGSNWVQDVRAAQGQAFIKRGRSCPVIPTEIPPEKRHQSSRRGVKSPQVGGNICRSRMTRRCQSSKQLQRTTRSFGSTRSHSEMRACSIVMSGGAGSSRIKLFSEMTKGEMRIEIGGGVGGRGRAHIR